MSAVGEGAEARGLQSGVVAMCSSARVGVGEGAEACSSMNIEALCAAPPEAPSLQVGPVAAVGVGHFRIVRHLLVWERDTA